MLLRWQVDIEATTILWREMWDMERDLMNRSTGWVANLGGAAGSSLAAGARLVTVDVDQVALRRTLKIRRPVRADIRLLPIRDAALEAAAGRAILHHVPEDLDASLKETRRTVKPGGFVLFQEPTSGNRFASLARRWFPTDLHDPDERPLSWDTYLEAIGRHFELIEARPYFLLSYLFPHLVARLPPEGRRMARALTRLTFSFDQKMLDALPGLRRRAAYVAILARRAGPSASQPQMIGQLST